MSTRKAETGSPFRQERYCSSAQLDRGLMANLVAARCDALDRAEDRELIHFLQLLSHREGGLKKVAAELVAKHPENVCTRSMLKFGIKAGKHYNAEQVKAVRDEMGKDWGCFPLRGEEEMVADGFLGIYARRDRISNLQDEFPSSYSASDISKVCAVVADDEFEPALKELCLDPSLVLRKPSTAVATEFAPWYFQNAVAALRQYQQEWTEQRRAAVVVTELGRMVYDTLEFTLSAKCLTLIDGLARTGKTFSAKAWCEVHPGRARYVQVPSTNDDIGFFRAIAKSLGVSINLNSKAQELRQRIEEVLQRGDLAIVFDEAHYLWPHSNYRDAMPQRVNWIMTALVNHGVPISLVTTPQFLRTQKAVERKSSWTSEQFVGRIGHYQKLPDSLSESDLNNVAASLLPEGDFRALEILVRYAQGSAKYLAGIESVVRRARYLAGKEARTKVVTADIKRAIQESVIPSDSALAQAIAEPEKPSRRRREGRLQSPLMPSSAPVKAGQKPGELPERFSPRSTGLVVDMDRAHSPRTERDLVAA